MAKKKGRGRHIYFRDGALWNRLATIAKENNWSVNQLIEITLAMHPFPKKSKSTDFDKETFIIH